MRPLGSAFGVILGVLGRSWRPLGRLGGVLGRLGVLGNAEERPTIFGCVWGQDQDLRQQGHVVVITRSWGLL